MAQDDDVPRGSRASDSNTGWAGLRPLEDLPYDSRLSPAGGPARETRLTPVGRRADERTRDLARILGATRNLQDLEAINNVRGLAELLTERGAAARGASDIFGPAVVDYLTLPDLRAGNQGRRSGSLDLAPWELGSTSTPSLERGRSGPTGIGRWDLLMDGGGDDEDDAEPIVEDDSDSPATEPETTDRTSEQSTTVHDSLEERMKLRMARLEEERRGRAPPETPEERAEREDDLARDYWWEDYWREFRRNLGYGPPAPPDAGPPRRGPDGSPSNPDEAAPVGAASLMRLLRVPSHLTQWGKRRKQDVNRVRPVSPEEDRPPAQGGVGAAFRERLVWADENPLQRTHANPGAWQIGPGGRPVPSVAREILARAAGRKP